mmetsp:Transcript_22385/g.24964  ORF Transcript_22385/g.24964 Transcript_22385/m.24964 type:complete len:108 (+) Transcript_22385:1-324(+)
METLPTLLVLLLAFALLHFTTANNAVSVTGSNMHYFEGLIFEVPGQHEFAYAFSHDGDTIVYNVGKIKNPNLAQEAVTSTFVNVYKILCKQTEGCSDGTKRRRAGFF